MTHRMFNRGGMWFVLATVMGIFPWRAHAQFSPPPPPPKSPPAWASELPGYWVSLITDAWRLRMVTPAKGDYIGIPLTSAAEKVANAWNPARDEADGQQCRSYGAAAIMFRPEHLHISWQSQNDKTLTMGIDDGMQTRVIHFGATAPSSFKSSWQGYSTATWAARRSQGYAVAPNARYLHVTTTHMLPGYLRQNGVPYSANAVLSEDYDLIRVSAQEIYLIVTTKVTDPLYLSYPLILSAIFQKQPTGAGWDPTPCSATW